MRKKEASPNPSEKPPQAPPKEGMSFPQRSLPKPLRKEGSFLLDKDWQYSPCLSSPERMGLPSFRRGRGRLFPVTALHVTRYIFIPHTLIRE